MNLMNDFLEDDQVFDDDTEDELIRTIAEPILEALLRLQDDLDEEIVDSKISVHPYGIPESQFDMTNLPDDTALLHFNTPQAASMAISYQYANDTFRLPEDFFKRLEEYLQKRLDEWYLPAVLH